MKTLKEKPGNNSAGESSNLQFNQRTNGEPLRLLTEEQWQFWKHNGYVVIPNAVPEENIDELVRVLWEFEEKDPDDPQTWYTVPRREMKMKELNNSGMVEIYNHPAMWNNRQYPKVHQAFADIWGTEKLWVTIDRANLNFPVRPEHEFKGFIHWDIDTSLRPLPVNVQGVLALNDTTLETGGFQCVPELYRTFDEWVKTQPGDRDPFKPDISGFELKKVTSRKGDLLIFNSMLPHGIRPNQSEQVRMAQYISMVPAEEHNQDIRQWRVDSWENLRAPEGYAFPGDPRNWEQEHASKAELSTLGKKLLGLELWP